MNWATFPSPNTVGMKGFTVNAAHSWRLCPNHHSQATKSARKATGARIAGHREHRGVLTKAVWPAIITLDELERVRAAVGRLPDGQREVLELHWFEGLPFPEVAAIVGASHSAVKVRAHRGYERLRQVMTDAQGPALGAGVAEQPGGNR